MKFRERYAPNWTDLGQVWSTDFRDALRAWGEGAFSPLTDEVELGESLWIKPLLELEVVEFGVPGLSLVEITIEVVNREPRCTEVTIHPQPGGSITTSDLSALPISRWVDELSRAMARTAVPGAVAPGDPPLLMPAAMASPETRHAADDKLRRSRRRQVTPELLQEVADVYNADASGAPTKAVAEHFWKSHSTAARWVGLARKRRLITKTSPGKASTKEKDQ